MLKHSYSSIKDFTGCARRFHQVRILRNFKSAATEATLYGERVHKAFELYLLNNEALPEDLVRHQPMLDHLRATGRDIYCEHKLGIRSDFSPCEFFDDDVWMRGIPDVLMIGKSGTKAWVVDWKTGKSARFADTAQLELMAAMVMAHFPKVKRVKGLLSFIVAGDAVKAEYTREQLPDIFSKWAGHADLISDALQNDVWNPRPSGLCKFCPVSPEVCEHR